MLSDISILKRKQNVILLSNIYHSVICMFQDYFNTTIQLNKLSLFISNTFPFWDNIYIRIEKCFL